MAGNISLTTSYKWLVTIKSAQSFVILLATNLLPSIVFSFSYFFMFSMV